MKREPNLIARASTHAASRQCRTQFQRWLRRNRRIAKTSPLPVLLRQYDFAMSLPSAYRIAVAEGIRGHRFNQTRYAAFWETINWDLPDSVLHAIWGVWRGNLRQRRLRIHAGPPRFTVPSARSDPRFIEAVVREKRVARRYDGPRPH
jgi:hypothetical protein